MKTYLSYGFFLAAANFVLTLVIFFLGFHTHPEKLNTGQLIMTIGGIAISTTFLVLGTRARRDEVPPAEAFGYGSALGAGVMIALVASLIGVAASLLYMTVINPNLNEVILQAQAASLEAKGVSQDKIDQIQKMSAMWMKPAVQAVFGFVIGMVFNTVIALITSAFLKRAASDEPPVAA